MNSNPQRYDTISQILHWLMVILLAVMAGIGYGREFLPGEWRGIALDLHKSIGMVFLLLVGVRIIWALIRRGILHATESRFEFMAAKGVHIALYGLMIALPVSGWLMVSAFGRPVSLFGIVDIPALLVKNRPFAIMLKEWHETLAIIILATAGLHATAALFHHFIRKDDVLKRMIPSSNRK